MRRAAFRMTMMALLLFVAGCDKCGNININVPGAGPKACTDASPHG